MTGSLRPGSGSTGLAKRTWVRLRAPWDPIAGRYRAPDEKTIRVVLDRLDPRALARAQLGRAQAGADAPSASVRRYCAGAALKDDSYLHVPECRWDHATLAETLRLHGLN
jgi:hypothetical protein